MVASVSLFLLVYLILPVYLFKITGSPNLILLFLFYLINIIIISITLRKYASKRYYFDSLAQEEQEKINILEVEHSKEFDYNSSLKEKEKRYGSLEKILEKINQSLDLDTVAGILTEEAHSLIAQKKGNCLLYLVDNQIQKLSLFKSQKENPAHIIKYKEGNIFDFWVLRHASPLLIEDVGNDFRFDLDKLKDIQETSPCSSLVAAPFVTENKLLGIIRLTSGLKNAYAQDDLRFLVAISDLGALALENSELFKKTQDLATHDSLTSLHTKGYFDERLKEELKRSARKNNPLSVLMLDIDFFKKYNDKFGHTAGDIVLKKISQIILNSLSNFNSTVSRFGGEEFCAVISGMDKNSAFRLAETLRERIEKEGIVLRRQETHVTVSIGISNFPVDSIEQAELIQLADKALYKAKEKGRNRVCSI